MPTKRSRLTKGDLAEYRFGLSVLRKLGIEVDDTKERQPIPKRFILEPIYPEFARVYDLHWALMAVVLPFRLKILKSGVMFIDAGLFTELNDGWAFDLGGLEEYPYLNAMLEDYPFQPATVLNSLLVEHPAPLSTCQREGLIVASDCCGVPATCDDNTLINFSLYLRDEQDNEFRFPFRAILDRHLRRINEHRRARLALRPEQLAERSGLFGPAVSSVQAGVPKVSKINRLDKPAQISCNDINKNFQ